jgi:signal transduction histidine kinase
MSAIGGKADIDLCAALNNLRTTQDRLVQTQKLASLGQLTAGIAHEIKNPLNFVNNFSGISTELIGELQDTLSSISIDPETHAEIKELTDTLRGNLEKVVHHGKRADTIVKSMLLHSGQSSGEHRSTDINALVEESLNRAYYGARAEERGFNIKLERSFDPAAGEVDLFPREITRASQSDFKWLLRTRVATRDRDLHGLRMHYHYALIVRFPREMATPAQVSFCLWTSNPNSLRHRR